MFEDKVVLITGASSGIGKTTGEMMLAQGATVIGTIRKDWDSFTDKAGEYPGKCFTRKLEVSDAGAVERLVREVQEEFGRIDILVNNAGVHMNSNVIDTTEEQWDLLFNTNVKGVYLTCHYVLPGMLERKSGVVINVASRVGAIGSPNSAAYCASKAAVINLTREMALDFSDQGIRIAAVAPGMVETPMVDRQFPDGPERKRQVMSQYPMRRFSRAEEVANVILFLASDKASNLTGVIIPVDGGRSAF